MVLARSGCPASDSELIREVPRKRGPWRTKRARLYRIATIPRECKEQELGLRPRGRKTACNWRLDYKCVSSCIFSGPYCTPCNSRQPIAAGLQDEEPSATNVHASADPWRLYVMSHRYWIVLFMVGIPALLLLVIVVFFNWRDQHRLEQRGRARAVRRRRKAR